MSRWAVRRAACALLASSLAVGCAAPLRTDSPVGTLGGAGSPSATKSPSGVPSPAPSVTGLYSIAKLPSLRGNEIAVPEGVRLHRMSTDGSAAVFDEVGYGGDAGQGRTIWLADLGKGTVGRIAHTSGAAAWVPAVSGTHVAWSEWGYADAANQSGALSWRILVYDRDSGQTQDVASGVNVRPEAGGGIPPLVALDGDRLIYTVESPTRESPMGWAIKVVSLSSRQPLASVQTDLSIYQMAASGGRVAYTEGKVDEAGGFKYATRLMLWSGSGRPAQIASDAFELALGGDELAWISDPAASQSQVGLASHPRAWALQVGSGHDPAAVSAAPDDVVEQGAAWPSATSGFAAWSDMQAVGPTRASPNDLVIWSARLGRAFELESTAGAVLTGLGSGRLVWYDELDPEHPRISWVELSSIVWPAG